MNLLRDSIFGLVARFLTGDRILSYTDEGVKFDKAASEDSSGPNEEIFHDKNVLKNDMELNTATNAERSNSISSNKNTADEIIIVDWYSSDDPENPQNWTNLKRYSIGLFIW